MRSKTRCSTIVRTAVLFATCFGVLHLAEAPAFAQAPDDEASDDASDDEKPSEPAPSTVEPPSETWDITDVEEDPARTYMFVGLRYRGNIIPSFLLDLFLDETKTIYTNLIGVEFELRKNGFSIIPALSYHEVTTDDLLFKQQATPNIPGNYSVVNSGLKLVYASVDLLWSAKVHKNVDFEYGLGVGIGAVFGDLENTWVREDPNGRFLAEATGKRYTRCETVMAPGTGCNRADHQNSSIDKVGGYQEPSWFNGGSKPALFPWLAIPQIGVRIKPIKQVVARVGLGFGLTGFWFGLNGSYGLEQRRN